MQMCAVDKDLKREHAVDAVLLSTCSQHRLRLDIQLDLEGGGGGGFGLRLCDCVLKWLYIIAAVVKARRSSSTRSRGHRGSVLQTPWLLDQLLVSQISQITRQEHGWRHLCSRFLILETTFWEKRRCLFVLSVLFLKLDMFHYVCTRAGSTL